MHSLLITVLLTGTGYTNQSGVNLNLYESNSRAKISINDKLNHSCEK